MITEAEMQALFRLGLHTAAESVTWQSAAAAYWTRMEVIHLDKAGPALNNLTAQVNNDYDLVKKLLRELGKMPGAHASVN